MLYIVHCTDAPNTGDLRAATRDVHLQYLETKSDVIVLAGATLTEDGTPTGSHFIINVDDLAAAEAFAAGDPFAAAGIFASTHFSRMRKALWFPNNGDAA